MVDINSHVHALKAFDEPLQFRPRRWRKTCEATAMQAFILGFGVGRRSCIGEKITLTQHKFLLAFLVSFYEISKCGVNALRLYQYIRTIQGLRYPGNQESSHLPVKVDNKKLYLWFGVGPNKKWEAIGRGPRCRSCSTWSSDQEALCLIGWFRSFLFSLHICLTCM